MSIILFQIYKDFIISVHHHIQQTDILAVMKKEVKTSKKIPLPGLEPGSLGWEPSILTN